MMNHWNWQGDVQEKHSEDILTEEKEENQLIVFNDEVNTFDHVIDCLMIYCKHAQVQAEQCATIIHYKGKCMVKSGSFDTLRPICEALLDQGLTATIE